jgi:hypothetical protein
MLAEAKGAGLCIDEDRLQHLLTRTPQPSQPWREPQHESLHGAWWLAEIVPKTQWQSETKSQHLAVGLGRHRQIQIGSMIHNSALKRIKFTNYDPLNLSARFKARVKALDDIPDVLESF